MQLCELVPLILVSVCSTTFGYSGDLYTVPRPEILASARGFRVSILHEPGIEMFFFHGSINKEFDFLESGTIVMSAKAPTNGKWVVENTNTNLKVGDTIHYWLYVKKSGLGYTGHYTQYEIREILPYYSNEIPSLPPTGGHCEDEIRYTTQTIVHLQARITSLENTIRKLNMNNYNKPILRPRPTQENWIWN